MARRVASWMEWYDAEDARGFLDRIRDKKVGLVTNHSGVLPNGIHLADWLNIEPETTLTALFTGEHGMGGALQAGEAVDTIRHPEYGVPVYSLYGATKKPTTSMLEDVDVLIYYMQDVGVRYYTYLDVLLNVLRGAAEHDVRVIVLDRPAPFGTARLEGNVSEAERESTLTPFPMPIVYGLTIGELAAVFADAAGAGDLMSVVRLREWRRHHNWAVTGFPWIPPSPNIPTPTSALAFAATGLLQGTSVSEGRGTTLPFQLIGAPWLDAVAVCRELHLRVDTPGVRFLSQPFVPTFHKYQGELCQGVLLALTDEKRFAPVSVGIHILCTLRDMYPEEFSLKREGFDRRAGTLTLGNQLEHGATAEEIVASWQGDLEQYAAFVRGYRIYR